jgi:hypothetical protein
MKNYSSHNLITQYNKIIDCISSCTSIPQIMSCNKMITTFEKQKYIYWSALHREMCISLDSFRLGKFTSIHKELSDYLIENKLKIKEL